MLDGIIGNEKGTKAQALQQLLHNFYRRTDVNYQLAEVTAFTTGNANCQSLSEEYATLASLALGIPEVIAIPQTKGPWKGPQKPIVGNNVRGIQGNVDHGDGGRVFEYHAWVRWNSTFIDVLFDVWGGLHCSEQGKVIAEKPKSHYLFRTTDVYESQSFEFGHRYYTKEQ